MNPKEANFNEIAAIVECEVCAAEITGFIPPFFVRRCQLHQKTEYAEVVENLSYNEHELDFWRKKDRRWK